MFFAFTIYLVTRPTCGTAARTCSKTQDFEIKSGPLSRNTTMACRMSGRRSGKSDTAYTVLSTQNTVSHLLAVHLEVLRLH